MRSPTSHSQPCSAAPLLQVLSVRINSKSKKLVSVYGYIAVGEIDGYEYELFDRDKGDPENIYRGGFSLSLSGPTIEAITPSKGAIMCTSLKFNEQQGKSKESFIKEDIILDSLLDLEKDEPYLYNTIQSVVLESKNVSATVYYTTILHGIDAVVDMSFLKNIASADLPENVYLLVCARFTKSQHFAISESDTHLHTIIFRRSLSKFVETHGGVLVKKHVVVVPVYSSLIIEFYVGKLGSESCYGTMEFCVDKGPYERQYIRIPSGDVQVKVDWAPASKRFFQDTSVWGSLIPKVKSQRRFSNSRLEVFSICICGIDRDVGAVYGTVKIWDGDETYCIFEKDKKNYESVKNGSLSIYGPARSIGSTSYCIYLKDPHHRVGIKGNIGWTESSLEFNGVSDLFDKRLCMVVQGKGAYAVVHHTVFRGAAQATVNVSVSFRESENISALVHGLVAASYGKFEYLSCYEEKYYKSKLFERSKSEGVWVSEGDDLPLLKSVVAVTQHSSLVVEFDLKVSCGSPGYWSPEDEFNQKVGFMVAESGQATQIIRARMYDIEVSVNWRR